MIAEDSDRHEAERKVGHIFGATFRSHAVAAYIHMAHDTYGNHWTQKLVTFLGQLLAHMQLATCSTCWKDARQEAATKVGHIFGATFGSHAMVAYISCARDTYGNH